MTSSRYGAEEPISPLEREEPVDLPPEPSPKTVVNRHHTTEVRMTPWEPGRITLREVRDFVARTAEFHDDTVLAVRRVEDHHIRGESTIGEVIARHVEPGPA